MNLHFLSTFAYISAAFPSLKLNAKRLNHRKYALQLIGCLMPLFITLFVSFLSDVPYNNSYSDADLYTSSSYARSPPTAAATRTTSRSIDAVLADSFQIPTYISSVIPFPDKYKLLKRLQNDNLLLFVLHSVGSDMTGRLSSIASALSYASLTNRIVVVLWEVQCESKVCVNYPSLQVNSDADNPTSISSPSSSLSKNRNTNTNGNNFVIFVPLQNTLSYSVDDEDDMASLHVHEWSEKSKSTFFDTVHLHDKQHILARTSMEIHGRYIQRPSGIELLARHLSPNPSLSALFTEFVTPMTLPELSTVDVGDQLHRLYSIPQVFIVEMTDTMRRRLLYHLDRSKSKRVFFLHVQFGLGNRLRALGSAMAVAKNTGLVLVVIWVPDVHLNCEFSDLFINDLVVLSKFSMSWPPSVTSNDRALSSVDFYNFMRHEGSKQFHNPLKVYVDPRVGRHIYAKSAYVIRSRSTPRISSYTSPYWKTMRSTLIPVAFVMDIVERPDYKNIRGLVGVHVRSRSIKEDIKGVTGGYYGKGSRTTDFWRKKTNGETFAHQISKLPSHYRYFVAADTSATLTMLKKRFGAHRIYAVESGNECFTRNAQCAKLALVDIILLSRTRVLYGSHWSSFSEIAVRLSGKMKVRLAGVHF